MKAIHSDTKSHLDEPDGKKHSKKCRLNYTVHTPLRNNIIIKYQWGVVFMKKSLQYVTKIWYVYHYLCLCVNDC